jgi:hypothetical protein
MDRRIGPLAARALPLSMAVASVVIPLQAAEITRRPNGEYMLAGQIFAGDADRLRALLPLPT